MSKVTFNSIEIGFKFYSTRHGAWCIKVNPSFADYSRGAGRYNGLVLRFEPDELVIA